MATNDKDCIEPLCQVVFLVPYQTLADMHISVFTTWPDDQHAVKADQCTTGARCIENNRRMLKIYCTLN